MKRIIKKYDQYIKGNRGLNEDIEEFNDVPSHEMDSDDSNNQGIEDIDPIDQEYEMPGEESIPSEVSDELEEEGEEEGHQYKGNKMLSELADKLGSDVVNNSIEYNGKKINFFSETEMYHVDRKKFKTADEVVEYLSSLSNQNSEIAADEEADMMKNDEILRQRELETVESKSYRKTRNFKGFKKSL